MHFLVNLGKQTLKEATKKFNMSHDIFLEPLSRVYKVRSFPLDDPKP